MTIADPGDRGRIMRIAEAVRARCRRVPPWGWTVVAVLLVAADLRGHLLVDWIPHDEGALATAATLVRGGAWPHRDFTDIYSGGLALLGAGWQRIAGDDLAAARYLLFTATLLWIPVLVACFRRVASPAAAAALAVVAYAWGPPLYAAAMPSWLLLFLATALLWALMRWQESGHRRFLVAAGVVVGAGVLIKINALFLAAAALAVVLTQPPRRGEEEGEGWSWPGAALLVGASFAACCLLVAGWPWPATLGLALPLVILTAAWVRRGCEVAVAGSGSGRRPLLDLLALFGGMGCVVLPWVALYVAVGAGSELWRGIFETPFRRVASARAIPPIPLLRDLATAAIFLALLRLRRSGAVVRGGTLGILALTAAIVWLGEEQAWRITAPMWGAVRVLIPASLIIAGLRALKDHDREARALGAAVWVVAWLALIQYPFATPTYIAYIAPLAALPLAGLARRWRTPRPIGWAVGLGLLLLTGSVNHGIGQYRLGLWRNDALPLTRLPGPHGGVFVTGGDAAVYGALDSILDRWGAARIIAGPDAPEVYYLTDRPKLDRELFEFFSPDWSARTFARRIDSLHLDAVVLDQKPGFSRISMDSVVASLSTPWIADTTIGRFRLLRFTPAHASP